MGGSGRSPPAERALCVVCISRSELSIDRVCALEVHNWYSHCEKNSALSEHSLPSLSTWSTWSACRISILKMPCKVGSRSPSS